MDVNSFTHRAAEALGFFLGAIDDPLGAGIERERAPLDPGALRQDPG